MPSRSKECSSITGDCHRDGDHDDNDDDDDAIDDDDDDDDDDDVDDDEDEDDDDDDWNECGRMFLPHWMGKLESWQQGGEISRSLDNLILQYRHINISFLFQYLQYLSSCLSSSSLMT